MPSRSITQRASADAVHGAPERRQLGNFEHPLAWPDIGEVAGDDVRDRGQLAAAIGAAQRSAQGAQGALDVRVALAAFAHPGDEHLLALRGKLGDGQVAQILDAVAERAALDVGAGEVLAMLQPIALDDLGHGYASGVGVAEFAVLDDELMEQDLGPFRVLSAEAVARDLSAASIVVAGVEVAGASSPEEPARIAQVPP